MDFVVKQNIVIRTGTDLWGPFSFDLTRGLPSGDSISSVAVTSWLGTTESTSYLIDSAVINGNIINIRFQFPGSTRVGNHEVRMLVTCASGAKFPFIFRWVVVTA